MGMGRTCSLLDIVARSVRFTIGDVLADAGAESDGVVTFTDDERLSRFEIPESWHVYELSELSELEDMPFDEQVQGFSFPAISSVGFDGGPVRDSAVRAVDPGPEAGRS